MSKHLHIDPVSGVAGDMFLGLLVDLGLDLTFLADLPGRLGLEGVEITQERVMRGSLAACKIHVRIRGWEEGPGGQAPGGQPPGAARHLSQMLEIASRAELPSRARALACETITRLFQAEAQVHGQTVEQVHLHEAGADDALVDIVGTCAGIVELGIESMSCSTPLPVGGGTIRCAHGVLPVPGPAVSVLLKGLETIGGPIEKELITPTGAALLRSLVDRFGPQPAMSLLGSGYGAGTRDDKSVANILRGSVGSLGAPFDKLRPGPSTPSTPSTSSGQASSGQASSGQAREIAVITTTLDDMLPQDVPVLLAHLLEEGALDAWTHAVQMKKGRQGIVITALALPPDATRIAELLLRESPTLGVRLRYEARMEWARSHHSVETRWGTVRIKQAIDGEGRILRGVPEFEDCLEIAQRIGRTVEQVRDEAKARYREEREEA